jgi:hypothetical protein
MVLSEVTSKQSRRSLTRGIPCQGRHPYSPGVNAAGLFISAAELRPARSIAANRGQSGIKSAALGQMFGVANADERVAALLVTFLARAKSCSPCHSDSYGDGLALNTHRRGARLAATTQRSAVPVSFGPADPPQTTFSQPESRRLPAAFHTAGPCQSFEGVEVQAHHGRLPSFLPAAPCPSDCSDAREGSHTSKEAISVCDSQHNRIGASCYPPSTQQLDSTAANHLWAAWPRSVAQRFPAPGSPVFECEVRA